MLIRSQDKKVIVNLQSISQFYIVRGEVVADFNNSDNTANGYITLGGYDGEEKAIKVLDMIQMAYENSLYCDHAFDSAAQVQRPYIFVSNSVFQMPQDSEVDA